MFVVGVVEITGLKRMFQHRAQQASSNPSLRLLFESLINSRQLGPISQVLRSLSPDSSRYMVGTADIIVDINDDFMGYLNNFEALGSLEALMLGGLQAAEYLKPLDITLQPMIFQQRVRLNGQNLFVCYIYEQVRLLMLYNLFTN